MPYDPEKDPDFEYNGWWFMHKHPLLTVILVILLGAVITDIVRLLVDMAGR